MDEIISGVASTGIWLGGIISSFWAGLTWPHTVLIIFVLMMVFYRQELRALIERILEIGPSGFKLQPPVLGSQQNVSKKLDLPSSEPATVPKPLPDISPPKQESEGHPIPLPPIVFPEQMATSKKHVEYEIAGMPDDKARGYLADSLALTRSLWVFENCYGCIFGGQIRLLQIMNQRPARTITFQEINYYWVAHQEQVKPTLDLWNAEGYLQYLVTNGLVVRTGETLTMTNKGAEFLLWLVHYGRPLDRPL